MSIVSKVLAAGEIVPSYLEKSVGEIEPYLMHVLAMCSSISFGCRPKA
jgi:hypothetical protein